ncbi:MAG: hypothetical protein KH452_11435 [Clostridiales bacterium]|nr:hypothetical protein [Clostridiales bacterium]
MQEHRRRIAYLYAYEYGEKMRSAGFVKAEERSGRCRLEIHLKTAGHPGEDAGKAYIYFCHQNRTIGIYLGDLEEKDGSLLWQGDIDCGDILGKGIGISDTKGIWIRRPGSGDFVAGWDDAPVDISRFILYPKGGQKCIRCPWFGSCERSGVSASDRRGKVYEGSHPAGT